MSLSENSIARNWNSGRMGARVYDFTIRHGIIFRTLSRIVWRADVRPLYTGFGALRELPEETAVLDVPCGSGVAFRGMTPETRIRYVAADMSPFMLERARAE
ncbi:hypothetical protein ACFQ07_09940, partial [Actinomadura adrarensis]